jgi:hypothetical protein
MHIQTFFKTIAITTYGNPYNTMNADFKKATNKGKFKNMYVAPPYLELQVCLIALEAMKLSNGLYLLHQNM